MAKHACPTEGCDYTTIDPSALIDHRRNAHGVEVTPASLRVADDQVDVAERAPRAATPRVGKWSSDPLERIEWAVNQIRLGVMFFVALTVINIIATIIVVASAG